MKPCPFLNGYEMRILRLVADGKTYREIGTVVNRTEGTIRNQMWHMLAKARVDSALQLVVMALRKGWIS